MKKYFTIILSVLTTVAFAQDQDAKALHETAKTYMKQGDYSNALLVLNKALQQQPDNLDLLKDQAFTYYLAEDYTRSQAVSKKLLDRKDADPQTYQIAAMSYKMLDNKELDKLYKKGLKLFPNSGPLYSEYGELLWSKQDFTAIKQWEKGIEVDPNYSGNYYNAARYYYLTMDKVWSIVYGEIFVNLESYSKRTVEIEGLLLDSYKKLFTDADMQKNQDMKNPFVAAYIDNISKQASVATEGIRPASLTMIRTRFALNWFEKNNNTLPFRLFDYHRQLLREGMFEAYNQWLFGSTQNLTDFQAWTRTHADEYNKFINFQKGRVFKLPANQYYNNH